MENGDKQQEKGGLMTGREKNAYMSRYRNLCFKLRRLESEKLGLEEWATNMSASLSDMPKGGDGSKKLDNYVTRIEEIENDIKTTKEKQSKAYGEISSTLSKVKDNQERRYLAYYYLYCMTWEEIAQVVGYEPQYLGKKIRKRIGNMT